MKSLEHERYSSKDIWRIFDSRGLEDCSSHNSHIFCLSGAKTLKLRMTQLNNITTITAPLHIWHWSPAFNFSLPLKDTFATKISLAFFSPVDYCCLVPLKMYKFTTICKKPINWCCAFFYIWYCHGFGILLPTLPDVLDVFLVSFLTL